MLYTNEFRYKKEALPELTNRALPPPKCVDLGKNCATLKTEVFANGWDKVRDNCTLHWTVKAAVK